jgi:hypothetical protein
MALEHDLLHGLARTCSCKDVTWILPTYHPFPCGLSCSPRFHHPWNSSPRASGRRRRRLAELHFVRALVPSRVRLRSTNRAASASIPASCSSGSSCAGFGLFINPTGIFSHPASARIWVALQLASPLMGWDGLADPFLLASFELGCVVFFSLAPFFCELYRIRILCLVVVVVVVVLLEVYVVS